ncbi:hypothetical protein NMG60_11016051 [Bertholletia excelsa]
MSLSAIVTGQNEVESCLYPPPLASHEDVVNHPTLFWDTLRGFHSELGSKFMVPVIGGKELNLHVLYVEVTKRGGYDKVVSEKRWREISEIFEFSPTTTSASYALKKHYFYLLHHYEQVYFFRLQAPLNTITASGTIDAKFEFGYLISVKIGSEILNGVLYYPDQASSSSKPIGEPGTATIPCSGKKRQKGRRKDADPTRPKPNRSGYNFFFAEKYSVLKSLHPDREKELTKLIGESWTSLSPEERMVYQNYGLKDKERYQKEMKEYKERIKLEELNGDKRPSCSA